MAILDREQSYVALPQLEAEIKLLKERLANMLDVFYPVGSYYETSDADFDPNYEWGGVWELETSGQVHVSAGTGYSIAGALDNSSDGGEATHKLSALESGLPAHGHGFKNPTYTASGTNVGKHVKTACGRTTDVGLTNNHSASVSKQPEFNGPSHNHEAVKAVSAKLGSGTLGARIYAQSGTTGSVWMTGNGGAGACSRTQGVVISVPAHAITQPTFETPELTHSVTQPTISLNGAGSVTQNDAAGATYAHQNMPPYIVVNRWHRTE